MAKKLVTRTEFARMAGVAPASVTKACKSRLLPACDGKRIDAAHPAAVEYMENRARATTPPAAPGLDPLYEDAIEACTAAGRWSANAVSNLLNVGSARGKRIFQQLTAAGLVPERGAPPAEPSPSVATKKPHVRGTAAAKEKRKRTPPPEALAAYAQAAELDGRPGERDDYVFEVPEDIQAFADMTLRELIEKFGTDTRFVDWLKATQTIEAINEKRLKNAVTRGELVNRNLVRVGIIEPIDAAHIKLLTDGAKTIARRASAMTAAGREPEEIEKFVADQISSFIRPVKSKVARALANA